MGWAFSFHTWVHSGSLNIFLIQDLIARLEFMGRIVTTRALNVLPHLPSLNRTRKCNLTTTSPLPHANDCPNEVCPALPCRYPVSSLLYFQPWSYGPENFVILKKVLRLILLQALGGKKLTEITTYIVHRASIPTYALR